MLAPFTPPQRDQNELGHGETEQFVPFFGEHGGIQSAIDATSTKGKAVVFSLSYSFFYGRRWPNQEKNEVFQVA